MKNDDLKAVKQAIRQLLAGPLTHTEAIQLASSKPFAGKIAYGLHCHDTWELFCPLKKKLKFIIGETQLIIPALHLLLIPPQCLHAAANEVPQSTGLDLLVINLPGHENPYGGLSVGNATQHRTVNALSPTAFTVWTARVGAPPGTVMDQVAQAFEGGPWGRERALGLLRVLMAAYAESIDTPVADPQSQGARRVAEAQIFLQSHYYQSKLTIETVAKALGCSASHLGFLFRKITGQPLHQTLLDIRLRRATDLLTRTPLPIKEIAGLTGWANQLYFSAAFHRRHGKPPSAFRHIKPLPSSTSVCLSVRKRLERPEMALRHLSPRTGADFLEAGCPLPGLM